MDFGDLAELDVHLQVVSAEFHSKIRYDFNNVIFLGLRGKSTKELEEVVRMAASRDGYMGHKTFRYKEKRVSHFYIRFRNAACAEKAIVYFRAMDNKFNADIVKNILLTWYMVERTFDKTKVWTTTYVDIIGKTDIQDPLSTDNLRNLLGHFGNPRILRSNKLYPRFVQVLFPTMAQALAATIAIGGWFNYRDRVKDQESSYRLRIVGNSKEAKIFEWSGSSSQEAFEMDYFVPTAEVGAESELPEENNNQGVESSQSFKERNFSKSNYHGRERHGDKSRPSGVNAGFAAEQARESNEIHDTLKELEKILNLN